MRLPRITSARALNSDDGNILIDAINTALQSIDGIEQLLAMKRPYEQYSQSIIYAKITGSSMDGANRYKYTWAEVVKSTDGYGGWTERINGRVGTAENGYYARNWIEDMNAGTGTLGNGVAVSSLVGTFALKPAPVNTLVQLIPVRTGEGSIEYWFSYENGVDGACPG
jgi:hypothetical protein